MEVARGKKEGGGERSKGIKKESPSRNLNPKQNCAFPRLKHAYVAPANKKGRQRSSRIKKHTQEKQIER
jgi:hypothetical protein